MALRLATFGQDTWTIRQLILRGVSPNLVGPCGMSLLVAHLASRNADDRWVEEMLHAGADPNLPGRPARGQPAIAPLALLAGQVAEDGYLDSKNEYIIHALLAAGADSAPLHAAAKAMRPELREEIRKLIADSTAAAAKGRR
jgi:hypothetical protein